jgi:glycerophosphoryl diester phosphodiesterase
MAHEILNKNPFLIQGHRGFRGNLPENSLPAFQRALDFGIRTLEMDVIFSKDEKVVISHEAWPNPKICSDFAFFSTEEAQKTNFYRMNYDEIRQIECGTKIHPDFPFQKKIPVYKPLLTEVFELKPPVPQKIYYNIEIKSLPETDHIFHPNPEKIIEILLETIPENLYENIIIQSFDKRPLQILQKLQPTVKTALVTDTLINPKAFESGFIHRLFAVCYHYSLVTPEIVKYWQEKEMKVFVWTVNKIPDMEKMLEIKVDGIITDYPLKLLSLL